MTDALSMDPATMEAQAVEAVKSEPAADPWLVRRMASFGASEALTLLIALGLRQPTDRTPRYILESARKLFAVKAGLRKASKPGQAAEIGTEAERPLVVEWNEDWSHGWPDVTHADAIPREFLPLLDREQPRLSWTPDGWCRLHGELVPVEVKTDVAGTRTEPEEHWRWQVQQAMAVSGSRVALILYGPKRASWSGNEGGPIIPWVVEREDDAIATLRAAAADGWARVEMLKAAKAAKEKAK